MTEDGTVDAAAGEPARIDTRVASGITGFDTILSGGFLQGGLYIIQGPPGTGKTTLGNQICFHHAAGGGKALYVTLLAEYHARMMQHLQGMAFFDRARIPDQISYLNGLQVLHASGLKGLVDMLRREITSHGASVLVLDGIVAAHRIAENEQDFNEFVHALQAVAIAGECTMFMLTNVEGVQTTPEHTMVDGIVELSEELVGWAAESTLQVAKFRGSPFLRGRHAFKITSNGLVVHPRLEALLARPSREASPARPDEETGGRVSSGIAQLDVMLGGGLPESSTTMALGPSGSGKTTLGLQFLSGCSAAAPGLLFGFYETPPRLRAKIAGVCPGLGGLIDSGAVEIEWQPPIDDLLDGYGERLLACVHRRKVKRLFIDGLGALRQAALSEPNRIGNFLTALMNELRVLGVTTIYTLEVPDIMGPSVRTPLGGDLASLAENLVLLRFVEVYSQLHRLISVLKVRDSQFDSSLHQYVTSSRGLLIDQTSDNAQRLTMAYAGLTGPGDSQPRDRGSN
jgi:circadian clock protein KaiC